jgi:hypothetical protein
MIFVIPAWFWRESSVFDFLTASLCEAVSHWIPAKITRE